MDSQLVIRNRIKLSLKGAQTIIDGTIAEANKIHVPQNIAVTDECGELLAFVRMDNARIGSLDIAVTKARSAATRQRATGEESDGDALRGVRLAVAAKMNVTQIPGGLPIIVDGQVIGGVGVSSGTSQEDLQCAQAGLALFAKSLKP